MTRRNKSKLNTDLEPSTIDEIVKRKYICYLITVDKKTQVKEIYLNSFSPKEKDDICKIINTRSKEQRKGDNIHDILEALRYIRERYDSIVERQNGKDVFKNSFNNFVLWWFNKDNYIINEGQKCCYCKSTQKQWKRILDKSTTNKITTATDGFLRPSKKGTWSYPIMEIERQDPDGEYNDLNCKYACHICNNTKSDMISCNDYADIAKEIGNYLKKIS